MKKMKQNAAANNAAKKEKHGAASAGHADNEDDSRARGRNDRA